MRSKGHMAVSLCLATTQVCSEPGTDTQLSPDIESERVRGMTTSPPPLPPFTRPAPATICPLLATEPRTQRLMQIESGNQASASVGSVNGVQSKCKE